MRSNRVVDRDANDLGRGASLTTRVPRAMTRAKVALPAAAPAETGVRVARFTIGENELIVASYPTATAPQTSGLAHMEAQLTPAERQVLQALMAGHSRREIARDRNRSPATVSRQVEAIHRKLGVASSAELAVLCGRAADDERA